ncbi:MAG: hypothetical protein ACFNXZ_00485 [Lautropia mirabilis]
MMKDRFRVPMTAAALALLLAACGGGGGGGTEGKAVSASPQAPTHLDVADGASSTTHPGSSNPTSTPVAPTASPATPTVTPDDDRAGRNQGTSTDGNQPTAPSAVAALSSQGVRGEVLLSMLDQRPCDNFGVLSFAPDGNPVPEAQDDTPETVFGTTLSQPGNHETGSNYVRRPGVDGNPSHAPNAICSDDQMYAPARPGTTYVIHQDSNPVYRFTPATVKRGFHYFGARLSLRVSNDSFSIGNVVHLAEKQDPGRAYAEAHPEAQEPDVQRYEWTADSDLTIRNGALVPFGVLKEWKEGNLSYQILLVRGDQPGQAKLCWNTHLQHVKRLHCTVWNVPSNFRQGTMMKVQQYVADDRSTYEGEKGTSYWRAGND